MCVLIIHRSHFLNKLKVLRNIDVSSYRSTTKECLSDKKLYIPFWKRISHSTKVICRIYNMGAFFANMSSKNANLAYSLKKYSENRHTTSLKPGFGLYLGCCSLLHSIRLPLVLRFVNCPDKKRLTTFHFLFITANHICY